MKGDISCSTTLVANLHTKDIEEFLKPAELGNGLDTESSPAESWDHQHCLGTSPTLSWDPPISAFVMGLGHQLRGPKCQSGVINTLRLTLSH